jgi:hypothetical protein
VLGALGDVPKILDFAEEQRFDSAAKQPCGCENTRCMQASNSVCWGSAAMTKLITVHGTNAGDPNNERERWWQRNSPFQRRLAEWLDLKGVDASFAPMSRHSKR